MKLSGQPVTAAYTSSGSLPLIDRLSCIRPSFPLFVLSFRPLILSS